MSSQSRNRNTSASKQKKGNGGSSAGSTRKKVAAAPPPPERKPLLGTRVKNDLIGLGIAIVAIVLLVIILLPSDAVGAQFISTGFRLVFGQGAVILPFVMLAWAATFFVRRRLTNTPVRLAIGLGVIFLAVIAIFAVLTPLATTDPGRIFDPSMLTQQGGYVGGALAWVLLTLVGQVPTVIILVGLILVGLVLIGLSLTGLVDWLIKSIKGIGKSNDEIPLPGALQQGTGSAVSKSGGAYQMGPQTPGNIVGTQNKRSAGREALMQPTGVMGAAQLEHTLYRPVGESAQGSSFQNSMELGSTRRRFAHDGGKNGVDSQARTMVFGEDEFFEEDILEEDLLEEKPGKEADTATTDKAVIADTTISDTTSLTGAEKDKGRKKTSKTARQAGGGEPSELIKTAYTLPSKQLLRVSREKANTKAGASELRSTANRLQETLEEFRVDGEVVGWIAGPTVTLYKISLGEGVRLNRITALQSDIQLALAAQAIRIVAPIPGTSLVGIEIPNAARNEVLLGDVLDTARDSALALAIGKDVEGESIVADLASMPHLLIGGTTGSGKSVAINSIIMSLLMRTTPEEVRMIMIDPKRVELTLYNGIPHLYVPVVTDSGQAASALAWCVAEMDRRLKLFEKHAVKNIRQFNTRVTENLAVLEKERGATASLPHEESVADDDPGTTGELNTDAVKTVLLSENNDLGETDVTVEQENLRATLPYLVIVIDELADLMMMNGKEVEGAISRLAQLARAAGLHLVVATQRPSTNVITGLIKANIVNRIAFTVASSIDSRVILDTPGAEDLIGLGDMLFSRPEYSKPVRIQGCFVSEPEIETVVGYWRSQGEADYHEDILLASAGSGASSNGFGGDDLDDDPLLWEAAEIVVSAQLGSTSTLQRRLKVGYARAGRIMDMLEMKGIVGPPNGSKPREVLVDDVLDLETLRAYG